MTSKLYKKQVYEFEKYKYVMHFPSGISVKLAPVLGYIPMPVLYGVLMYMGVNTLNGMQFIDRCFLFFMPAKHQPDYLYLRHVPLKKVNYVSL